MSFTGVGSFGNYDRTAQTTGIPDVTSQGGNRDHDMEHSNARDEPADGLDASSSNHESRDATRTRATSITEVGTPSREKDALPGAGKNDVFGEDDGSDTEQERRDSMVQALARRYTTQSHVSGVGAGANPFLMSGDEDSPLNPNSPKFRARAWAKAVVDMTASEGHKMRTSGVAFQNLSVFGFGSTTDYQKDFINIWLEVAGLARKVLGHGQRRIDILRNFDGVVKNGEMLVVLGPPGSGCTTFLKTIAGDYNGIFMDDKSYFNYQGKRCSFLAALISRSFLSFSLL